jgi:hypothetical protein
MAVIPYWKERLLARCPLHVESLRVPANLRARNDQPGDTWPRAVAKQALFLDYQAWFDECYLVPYRETSYYQDGAALPEPAGELDFFITMSPFLHVVGRAQQTRSYFVREPQLHEGEFVMVKAKRNFVRLLTWNEHVAQFELVTGIHIDTPDIGREKRVENIGQVSRGVQLTIRKIAENKATMRRNMGKPEDA